MRAVTVVPGTPDSVRVEDVELPHRSAESVLVRSLAVGICGTDRDIVKGHYGKAPRAGERLILGHESLGEVLEAPADSSFATGDLVVGIVRRPDPVPCPSCAVGEWDMCQNGLYTERGIKERDGFGSERFWLEPEFAVRLDPELGASGVLVEPASIVAKAWEHIERIGSRAAAFRPRIALITGAGPVGLLAALMARQRELEVHVFDRVTDGPKPAAVRALGAVYHGNSLDEVDVTPDVVVECTGASSVVFDVICRTARGGVVCLAGISSGGRSLVIDGALLNRTMVLENTAVFGSVNANRRHYEMAARALSRADPRWLARLVTRRVSIERCRDAFRPRPEDIKVVLEFTS